MQTTDALPISGRRTRNWPPRSLTAGVVFSLALSVAGCSDDAITSTSTTSDPATTTSIGDSTTSSTDRPDIGPVLFTEANVAIPVDPTAARSRAVEVALDVLLDDQGRARDVEVVTLNLFPDVVYTGVITGTERSGDSYSWVGYLDGIEYSSLAMVYTASVFRAQFASPAGVYAVSLVGDGIYQAILIDQKAFPQGEG